MENAILVSPTCIGSSQDLPWEVPIVLSCHIFVWSYVNWNKFMLKLRLITRKSDDDTLVDLEGRARRPDSFVSTYKIFEA